MDTYTTRKNLSIKEKDKGVSSVTLSHKSLKDKILQKTAEAVELHEIIQKQLENIKELQKKCEESFIVINHLPQSKLMATERFEKAMKLSAFVQNKQVQVSELLNVAMKEFDETVEKIYKSRGHLESEVKLANERLMIYSSNLSQIKNLSEMIIISLRNSMSTKTSQLNSMKDLSDTSHEQKMNQKLSDMNSRISNVGSLNSMIENELSQVDFTISTVEKKTISMEENLINKIKTEEEKCQIILIKHKEGEQIFPRIVNEQTSFKSSNLELNEKCSSLKVKLLEEKEKSNTVKQEISFKKEDLDSMKSELEQFILNCLHLREKVEIVSVSEEESRLIEGRLNELEEQKVGLLDKQNSVIAKTDHSKEFIKAIERNLDDRSSCIYEIKIYFNNSDSKLNQLKETHVEEMKSFHKILLEINKSINEVQSKKANITDSFTTKKTRLEELQILLNNKREDFKILKQELNDIKERNVNRKTTLSKSLNINKLKYNEICEEIELRNSELKVKNQEKEETLALSEKIKLEKEKYFELMAKFEKEKNDLKLSFCENFESRLAELQKVKEEKRSALEKVKDNASKAEYTYYRLKRLLQRHLFEKNSIKDTFKSYNCENEMLRMMLSWLNSNTQDLSKENTDPPPVKFEDKGLPPEIPDAEEIEADEMLTHDYRIPTPVKTVPETKVQKKMGGIDVEEEEESLSQVSKPVSGPQDSQGEMKAPSLSKRFLRREATVSTQRSSAGFSIWKKPKKDVGMKTILDLVVDSADSQSSA